MEGILEKKEITTIEELQKDIAQFEKEVQEIVELGYEDTHANCFICNYFDEYICATYNGGCKCQTKCKEIKNKIKIL